MYYCLFITAPSLEARAQKARSYRKAPGASGRLHRTEAGDWVWSSDSEEEAQSDEESDEENPAEKPPNPLIHKGLLFPKNATSIFLRTLGFRVLFICVFQKGCLNNSQVIIELPIRIYPVVVRTAAQVPPVNTMKLVPQIPNPLFQLLRQTPLSKGNLSP